MIEYLTLSFAYTVIKDTLARLGHRNRKLTNSQIVELRKKWKGEFEPHILKNYTNKLRHDVIIRDMKRVDNYPDIDDKAKGISPWFRVGLTGTYHRGILIMLRIGMLTEHTDGKRWRYTDSTKGEKGDIKVLMIGSIPYENIDNVDWDGDEYYSYPHIYCFFSHKRQPYEHLGFYTETVPSHGVPFYTEVAAYGDVRRLSKKLGISYFS